MFKRALFIFLTVAILTVWPTLAQSDTPKPADFVPADFAGFVQLNTSEQAATLQGLNITAFIAAQLQPLRVSASNAGVVFDDLISLDTLFDIDGATFDANILPWLGDEMVIAYRDFDSQLGTTAEDALLIFSTNDVLETASSLSAVITAQDLLERQEYRGITVYLGDKVSIALTSPAVFIGPTELIHAALDVQAGVSEGMTDSPVYHALRALISEDSLVFAYVDADHVLPAVSGLLSGESTAQALLTAFGGALGELRGADNFESLLLNNQFDGAAAGLEIAVETEQIFLRAKAVFHSISAPPETPASESQADLLDMIPQNALVVGDGNDAEGLVYDVMTALPMSNFARELIGGLPIQTVGTASDQITVPDAQQVQNAVNGYLTMMQRFNDFDLKADLLDHLDGDYALALLPRPNNPVPVLNVPFDVLIVARVNDEEGALAGATTLLQSMLNLDPMDSETIEDWEFSRLGAEGEPVLSLGAQDGLLIIGTGDTAERALDAQKGDNRLTNQDAWQLLSETATPGLYVDSFVFFNTLFPSPGGQVVGDNNRVHFGFYADYLGRGIYELRLMAVVPNG